MRMAESSRYMTIFIVFVIVVNIILNLRKEQPPEENSDITAGLLERNGDFESISGSKCLVSYVMYAPRKSNDRIHQVCMTNANIFLSRGVVNTPRVDYVFNLVGTTPPTSEIAAAARSMSNVNISRVPNQAVDIFAHLHVIRSTSTHYKYYILLNCGARGPYFMHSSDAYPLKPSIAWISHFTDPLRKGASAVGATISPEISPHIQTYAMALNYEAARFALRYWEKFNGIVSTKSNLTNNLALIATLEVGLSTALINGGFNIASLDTRMQDLYSSKSSIAADLMQNPTSCRVLGKTRSSGCEGVEPCEVIFVKYGGTVITENVMPKITVDRFSIEDTNAQAKKPFMCSGSFTTYRPHWEIPSIFKNISDPTDEGNWIAVDLKSDLAIIVRVHSSYAIQLITLLWMLEISASSRFTQVRVFVVPTDQQSVLVLRDTLEEHWNVQKNGSVSAKRVRVSLMEFPTWLYEKYGPYLANLCNRDYKAKSVAIYGSYAVSRFCDVNSPLHYLLCDLTLHYIMTSLTSCKWVMTTNADNFYSPGFFEHLAKTNVSEHDIMMSNMLTRGHVLDSKPSVGGVDLGAYAVSYSFMKMSNASFLNSLPRRCGPAHYHNADGHFIEYLVLNKARIKKTAEFFFIHN